MTFSPDSFVADKTKTKDYRLNELLNRKCIGKETRKYILLAGNMKVWLKKIKRCRNSVANNKINIIS